MVKLPSMELDDDGLSRRLYSSRKVLTIGFVKVSIADYIYRRELTVNNTEGPSLCDSDLKKK